MRRDVTVETLLWQGLTIEVSYEANWLGSKHYAHLQLRSMQPTEAPLPVSETDYRSHFLTCGVVEGAGGALVYAKAWLDDAAKGTDWRSYVEQSRQLTLF